MIQLYKTDPRGVLISGPHARIDPKVRHVATEHAPPTPGDGEAVQHVGQGRWQVVADPGAYEAAPPPPNLTNLDQGQFRLLFTFAERQAEETYRQRAIKLVQGDAPTLSDPPTPTEYDAAVAYARAQTYLAMRADFDAASHINLTDAAVRAALEFYVDLGLLVEARVEEVLSRVTPA